jgi:probable DNA repair protein
MLWQLDKTTNTARAAWRLQHDWEIKTGSSAISQDHRVFQKWSKRFARLCAESGFIDSARLAGEIGIGLHHSSLPVCLLPAGFDQITPAQQHLLSKLEQHGCEVRYQRPLNNQAPKSECHEYTDVESEFNAAAVWARKILQADAQAHIGVVIPDLQRYRAMVERRFENVFYPRGSLSAQPRRDKSFHISLGVPLASSPLITAALVLLKLISQVRMPLHEFGFLLRSPFFGGAERERSGRAMLDQWLRLYSDIRPAWTDVLNVLQKPVKENIHCPILSRQMTQVNELRGDGTNAKTPRQWARQFTAWLSCFSWPGERTLDTFEYQTMEAWDGLLADFTGLETIQAAMTLDAALTRLQQMAQRTFQAQENPAPVQILGVFEAGGMSFTHLWITGLHDAGWPVQIQPNPFLPIGAQRAAGIPQSDIVLAHEQSNRLLKRLCASATTTVMSYPRTDGNSSYGPNALLDTFSVQPAVVHNRSPLAGYAMELQPSGLESISDPTGLPINHGFTSGTGLFTDQSACPFRAYARHRLGADVLHTPAQGLDAMQRGIAMHDLLRLFWSSLGSQCALCELSNEALTALVKKKAFSVLKKHASTRQSKTLMQLEIERLVQRVSEWLVLEREREPFAIERLEQDNQGQIGRIKVKLRPDRVDRLEDGGLLIIDYKTGPVDRKNWLGERLREPQLPIYRLLLGDGVQGIAYGCLKAGKVELTGLASRDGIAPDIHDIATAKKPKELKQYRDWQTLSESWEHVLSELSVHFCAGDARVNPRDDDACRLCDVRPLCRIDGMSPMLDDEPE